MFGPARSILFRALCLGVATGLRSNAAGAALAWHQPDAPRRAGWASWPVLRSVWGRRALMLAAAGELIGDKLPMTPSRLQPGPLAGRTVIGAIAGAAIGSEGHDKATVIRCMLLGGIGGAVGAYSGYHARKEVGEATGLPDPAVAVVEDVVAISLANAAVQCR